MEKRKNKIQHLNGERKFNKEKTKQEKEGGGGERKEDCITK